jgi:hypothetical protein
LVIDFELEMQLRNYLLATLAAACGGNGIDITSDAAADAGTDTTLSDASADGTSPCGTGETLCGNTCFANDVNHCGPSCVTCGAPTLGVATCDGTTCGFTCTFMQCGSTCVDPSNDAHNCGSCGRDCLGASCASGMCQPEEIYAHYPDTLVVDAKNLYWLDYGTTKLFQGPKGGGTELFLTSGVEGLVAVDATNVYYVGSNGISIVAIPIGGGTSIFATSPGTAFTIKRAAVDSKQNVYFTTGYPTTTLQSVGVVDGGPVTAVASVVGYWEWFDVQAGQPYVAWRDFNPPYFTRFGPTTSDGGVAVLSTVDAGVSAFALDSNNAYLAGGLPATVFQTPLDGGATTVLATSAGMGVVDIATDGKYVYWITGGGGSELARVAVGTTSKEVLVPGGAGIAFSGLAIDATYAYFAYSNAVSPGKTGIYRTAK